MIKSRADYHAYLEEDKKVNHIEYSIHNRIMITWRYIKCLRKLELISNCRHGIVKRIGVTIYKYKLYCLSVKSGLTIPMNTCGKGIYIPHHGTIVINATARLGDNCIIQCGVNVSEQVTIGDGVYLGSGAKIMKNVHIANNVIVGSNAVVTKNIVLENSVVGGIPATIISNHGTKDRTII